MNRFPIAVFLFSILSSGCVFFTGCNSTAGAGSPRKTIVATNNGARMRSSYKSKDQSFEWSGGVDEKGFAHGEGTVTITSSNGTWKEHVDFVNGYRNGECISESYDNGKVVSKTVSNYVNGVQTGKAITENYQPGSSWKTMVRNYNSSGQLDGEDVWTYPSGSRHVNQWSNGTLVSSTDYLPDGSIKPKPKPKPAPAPQQLASESSGTSDSSDLDSALMGGMFALGGAYGGDAAVAMAGMQMMQGDDSSAFQTLQQGMNQLDADDSGVAGASRVAQASMASTTSGSASSVVPAVIPAAGSVSGGSANGVDLIEKYQLDGFRGSSDHIAYYISAADKSLADYRKTGDGKYYERHREYADTALQFHRQTSTQGTRLR